jgi:hypothetical protein
MTPRDNIGRFFTVSPTSAVMGFYWRKTGIIRDVIELANGDLFYLVYFDKADFKTFCEHTCLELSPRQENAGDLMGAFDVKGNFYQLS